MRGKICVVGSAGGINARATIFASLSSPLICQPNTSLEEENIFKFHYSEEIYKKPISITKATKEKYSFGYTKKKLK